MQSTYAIDIGFYPIPTRKCKYWLLYQFLCCFKIKMLERWKKKC